jgi:hypothetical protein
MKLRGGALYPCMYRPPVDLSIEICLGVAQQQLNNLRNSEEVYLLILETPFA